MLGMHGTYEANLAMHDCDVMVCIGARFDDRITGRIDAFSPRSKKIHIDIDPSSINKNVKVDVPIIGDVAYVLEELIRAWKAKAATVDKTALKSWWAQIDKWRAKKCLAYKQLERLHHAAVRDPAALRADQGPRRLHHHRGRPAPDVGGAVLPLRGAEPLDDLGRARHHGLRPAGGHRRADGAPQVARHRHRRRRLDPHEHPGDVDGRAVPPAGEGVHPQQPVHGHGAAVAAAAARQPHLGELHGGAARLRQAGRGLRRHRHHAATSRPTSTTPSWRC